MKTTSGVLLLVMVACAPPPAPTAKVWTPREFSAKRAVTEPLFGGWAPSELLVTEGQPIPFTTRKQGPFEGLTVFPGVSDGRAVGFVITDIWKDHPAPWVQPVYRSAYKSDVGVVTKREMVPGVFPVGLDSTFYSPWWRMELVLLEEAESTSLKSSKLALDQKADRTMGPLVLCPIVPSTDEIPPRSTFDVAAETVRKPVHPLTGAGLQSPPKNSAFVDDKQVVYLEFGPGRAPFDGQRLIESELFVFVKDGKALPVAAVMPAAARAHGFLRRVEVEVPKGAAFFVPSNRSDLSAPLGELAPPVAGSLDGFQEYGLRLARDPACFSSPNFPRACDWLDAPEKVRDLPFVTRREVQLTAAVLDEVSP
jgi:hypothetical protein